MESELHRACRSGNKTAVKALLKSGADPDARDSSGRTPLWIASQLGRLAAMEPLLRAGAQVDCCQSDGATPLAAASQAGSDAAVDKLLEAGANLDLRPRDGSGPLLIATQTGHAGVVQRLLASKADVDLRRNDLSSPLLISCQYGQQSALELLLQAGPDLHLPNSNGSRPLYAACWFGYTAAVEKLHLAGAEVNDFNSVGYTPLHKAAENGHLELVGYLISIGAKADAPNNTGALPLHLAAEMGHAGIVTQLLAASPDSANARDQAGDSPLHRAARRDHKDSVRVLLSAGSDVKLENSSGDTPLTVAAAHSSQPDVLSLLLIGASPKYIEAAMTAAFQYGRADNALQMLNDHFIDAKGLRRIVPNSCLLLATGCLRRVPRRRSNSTTATSLHHAWTKARISDSLFSQQLSESLARSGFTRDGSIAQQAEAEILQKIARTLKPNVCINVVGSFSEGWGSSLASLDGRIDEDSDIDYTEILPVEMHLVGYCKCASPDPENLLKYEGGYARFRAATANPSNPQLRTLQSPAMDYVNALKACCYPEIDALAPGRPTHIPSELLEALRRELKSVKRPCHLVRAAPPDKEGEWLRLSTTFLERLMIRSFSTLQGQLFVILKFIIKRHLSKTVSGLKTYVGKTLMFRMIDETPAEEWCPENLLQLTEQALLILISGQQQGGEHECLRHFFAPDAAVYLRKGHSAKEDILNALKSTVENLCQPLMDLVDQLIPIGDSDYQQFHPFTLVPGTHDLHPDFDAIRHPKLYPVVWFLFRDLASDASHPSMSAINNIPDFAFAVRESLRAMAQLKNGDQNEALRTLSFAAHHRVCKRVVGRQSQLTAREASEKLQQMLEEVDASYRFCFRYDKRPELNFLPQLARMYFPQKMLFYGNRFYMNFDCLLKWLCLELIPTEVLCESHRWFEELLHDHQVDVLDLTMALHFCPDANLLACLIQRERSVFATLPFMRKCLEDCSRRLPNLIECCIRRTLMSVDRQLRQANHFRRRRRRSGRLSELPQDAVHAH